MGHIFYILLVFLSAFLLFLVQPAFAKVILPWFGGGAGVWSICLVFFQTNLFIGYLYSHLLQKISRKSQTIIHLAIILGIAIFFPIAFDNLSKPAVAATPYTSILYILAINLGLPFFLLSTTSVLAQSWHARSEKKHTYELYAYSNAGSLLALISYPFLIEPYFDLSRQFKYWNILFGIYAILYILCVLRHHKTKEKHQSSISKNSWNGTFKCLLLAMLSSALLVAATNRLCSDIAPFPFLWILPLAIYLLTFILCFTRKKFYFRERWTTWAALATLLTSIPLILESNIFFAATAILVTLFCCLMVAHGEIALSKPHTQHLTRFYLAICAGGAIGSALVSLAAPFIFRSFYEYHLLLAAFLIYSAWLLIFRTETRVAWKRNRREAIGIITFCAIAILFGIVAYFLENRFNDPPQRNFYGVTYIRKAGSFRGLFHGRILQGACLNDPEKETTPISYYCSGSGIHTVFENLRKTKQRPLRVGLLGLGTGAFAGYGKEGDTFVYYEINPDIIQIAREKFPFLKKTKASIEIVPGDARLSLEREQPRQYDILVLDAFNSDAIPMHLLTKEAFEIYLRHVVSDGFIVANISNIYFNLFLPMTGIAQNLNLHGARYYYIPTKKQFPLNATSHYAILSRQPFDFDIHETNPDVYYEKMLAQDSSILWTDRFCSVFPVLKPLTLPAFITDYLIRLHQKIIYRQMNNEFRQTLKQWQAWDKKHKKIWKDWDKNWAERNAKLDQQIEELKKNR